MRPTAYSPALFCSGAVSCLELSGLGDVFGADSPVLAAGEPLGYVRGGLAKRRQCSVSEVRRSWSTRVSYMGWVFGSSHFLQES